MRRLLLFLPFLPLLSTAQLSGSHFHMEVSDTTLYGLSTESTFYGDIDLYNDTSVALPMIWERIEENIPTGWETSNCSHETCHPIGVTSGTFTLPAGSTKYVNAHFYPNNVAGSGYMKVKVVNTNSPMDSVVVTYYGVAGAVGIEEITASDIQVFPVPTRNYLNIMIPLEGERLQLDIRDISGKRVSTHSITSNSTTLDVSDLSAGLYMAGFSHNGHLICAKRFVKR